jgi:hypothetical protein
MALGTVNSGQFSAQCGSANSSVFESVRGVILLQKKLNLNKTWPTISGRFSSKKSHIYSQENREFSSLTDLKFC